MCPGCQCSGRLNIVRHPQTPTPLEKAARRAALRRRSGSMVHIGLGRGVGLARVPGRHLALRQASRPAVGVRLGAFLVRRTPACHPGNAVHLQRPIAADDHSASGPGEASCTDDQQHARHCKPPNVPCFPPIHHLPPLLNALSTAAYAKREGIVPPCCGKKVRRLGSIGSLGPEY